ncbi:hypothetical protein KGY71_01830 [Candidatus Bipolaricaulota bacterium]|nr:hypothetical protein [Candidatus Bipolaricaulota bacterium]
MDPRRKLKNLANPSYVTGLILSAMSKLARLAILDLAKYFLKKLSGRFLNLPDPFRLPRRYKVPSFSLSVLGTVFLWGAVLGLFVGDPKGPSPFWFLCLTALFYGFALGVLVIYRRGTTNLVRQLLLRAKHIFRKFKRVYRIWFP